MSTILVPTRIRSALVTGAAGFIGSHLVEHLLAVGCRVTAIVRPSGTDPKNLAAVRDRIDLIHLDLQTDDIAQRVPKWDFDAVFHLAGSANVNFSVGHPQADLQQNVVATVKLLETLRQFAPRTTLVYASSATVYGEGVTNPVRETDPKIPASPYGASKLACENYVRLYAELYALPTVIGCLFSVFGPRLRKQIVWDIMKKLAVDPQRLPLFGDGSQIRDFSYVSNVCDALEILAERAPKQGERYNIASGAPVSVAELALAICAEFGCKPVLEYSGSVRPGETHSWYPDVSAVRALGYVPQIDFQTGIARTVKWFLAEHSLL